MKIGIIYHSGTGTTAKLASEITQGWRSLNHQVEIFRIRQGDSIPLTGYDIIGIGTPTMGFRAPSFVVEFLSNFPESHQPYFLFNTCAGTIANTFYNLFSVLAKKGWKLIGTLSTKGQGTANILAWRPALDKNVSLTDGLSENSLETARQFPTIILENFQNMITTQKVPSLKEKLRLSYAPMMLMKDSMLAKGTTGKKTVNLDKCTRCGLCATKICPSGCITLNEEKIPQFNEKLCISCQGCVNLCPSLAIEAKGKGKIPYTVYGKMILS